MNNTIQNARNRKEAPALKKALNLRYAILQVRKTVDSANSKSLHRDS